MSQISIDLNVEVPMRDGMILRADVYRPAAAGSCPVLIQRTPHDRTASLNVLIFDTLTAVKRGYIVVQQDTRGRSDSDGEWLPWAYEQQEGYDTVVWATGLPGNNGKIGMFGGSYTGQTQWAAALARGEDSTPLLHRPHPLAHRTTHPHPALQRRPTRPAVRAHPARVRRIQNRHLVRSRRGPRPLGPMGTDQHRRDQPRDRALFRKLGPTGKNLGAYVFTRPPSDNEWHTQPAGQTRLTITATEALHTVRTAWASLK